MMTTKPLRRAVSGDAVDPALNIGPVGHFKPIAVKHAHADPETVTEFVSRIGYQLPVALADLIDNAIDAHATRVHVGLIMQDDRPAAVVVADNGRGMDAVELERAVSLEKDPRKQSGRSLGRYGAGLKAASFSLGRVLTIATRRAAGSCLGARLDQTDYKAEYQYGLTSPQANALLLEALWGGRELGPSGTVLVISDLTLMVPRSNSSQDSFLRDFVREVDTRLGLVFHRFLESGRLAITKGKRAAEDFRNEFDTYSIPPVNPFGYPSSGHKGYPQKKRFHISTFDVHVVLHLWPKQGRTKASRDKNYDILGRSGEWQGFYFYRSDRLLQTGGWNGFRSQEPHWSYARIAVDLPPGSDSDFRPTVMKDRIENPRPLFELLSNTALWTEYVAAAERVYRGKASNKGKSGRSRKAGALTPLPPRPVFVRTSPGVGIRLGPNGLIQLDRRLVITLGQENADAISELVRQSARPVVGRKRLSPEMKRDWQELNRAVQTLARRHR